MAEILLNVPGIKLNLPTYFRQNDIGRLVRALRTRSKLFGYYNPKSALITFPDNYHLTDNALASHYFSEFKEKEGRAIAKLTIIDTVAGRALFADLKKKVPIVQKRRMLNDPWYFKGYTGEAPGFFSIDFIHQR